MLFTVAVSSASSGSSLGVSIRCRGFLPTTHPSELRSVLPQHNQGEPLPLITQYNDIDEYKTVLAEFNIMLLRSVLPQDDQGEPFSERKRNRKEERNEININNKIGG